MFILYYQFFAVLCTCLHTTWNLIKFKHWYVDIQITFKHKAYKQQCVGGSKSLCLETPHIRTEQSSARLLSLLILLFLKVAIIIKEKIGLKMISVTIALNSLESGVFFYLSYILRSAGNLNDGSSGASDADIFTKQNVTMPFMK